MGCLIKPQSKNSTQTIFQGGSPWATLILNSMFVVVVHFCVQLLPGVTKSNSPFILFLCKSFFYFLSSILLKFSGMSNFPKYRMPYSNPIENSTQTIFQGGSPWETLILNSMFGLGPTIVSSCCLRWKFSKSFSPFLFLSFANTFLFFYFLSSILLEFSKCLISTNIGRLIKTQLKNSTQIIFQGGSPWATLILNSMFVLGVLPFLC